jgi:hypothetical protein
VMPMDEFEMILGQELLRRTHSVLMPWMDKMVMLGEQNAWFVCTMQGSLVERCNLCLH